MNAPKLLLGTGAACLLASHVHAQNAVPTQTLQPSKPWIVHYDDTECYAERTYGTAENPLILGLRPSPGADSYELLLAVKRPAPKYAQQLSGTVDFGKGPIKAWLLRYGLKDASYRVDKFRIDAQTITQATTASNVAFRTGDNVTTSLTLSAVPGVITALDKCNEDLRRFWNMTDDTEKLIAQPAVGDVRHVFTDRDYPDEAGNLEGEAQFLLLVDERGGIGACYVTKPSGIPAFDGMGCQVIRERAKFKPARNKDGKAVRSAVVTPPVIWRYDW